MSEYTPDEWKIVKVTFKGEEPLFKVFASWRGGYLSGDSWKLNSGIESAKVNGIFIEFLGSSGSVYKCHADMYGSTVYTEGVLQSLKENAIKQGIGFEILPEHEAVSLLWV